MKTIKTSLEYRRGKDTAATTDNYLFNQLIPYIGNKRKLLGLIQDALRLTDTNDGDVFVDLFAGSGVVSRLAKQLGYQVIANDWEPYAEAINRCFIACNSAPEFGKLGGYATAIEMLNNLPPVTGWITEHLCPRDDDNFDTKIDRMFYKRKNGQRIDAIRQQIMIWRNEAIITDIEEACLLAPLLYQACYTSNTSGVFKGFHNGWGGKTSTALYRIAADLKLSEAVFYDNELENEVHQVDAMQLDAMRLADRKADIVYLDPPYNQHPYGSNYHVLNSITLWDKPKLSKQITRGTKSAIRTDWRTERRSAYNYKAKALIAYTALLHKLHARYILTSYSTDGTIPLAEMLAANIGRGYVDIVLQGYKRYRVSSQRYSFKPLNIEFVLITDTHRTSHQSKDDLLHTINNAQDKVLAEHPEA